MTGTRSVRHPPPHRAPGYIVTPIATVGRAIARHRQSATHQGAGLVGQGYDRRRGGRHTITVGHDPMPGCLHREQFSVAFPGDLLDIGRQHIGGKGGVVEAAG